MQSRNVSDHFFRILSVIPAVLFDGLLAWCVSGCCAFRIVGTRWTPRILGVRELSAVGTVLYLKIDVFSDRGG